MQRKPNPVEKTYVMELKFRGTWQKAPLVISTALETDYIGDTDPYAHTAFIIRRWLEDKNMEDDKKKNVQPRRGSRFPDQNRQNDPENSERSSYLKPIWP